MSRVLHIALPEEKVSALCTDLKMGWSVIEPLPAGGTRIVLNNDDDTAKLAKRVKASMITGPVERSANYLGRQVPAYR